MYDGQGGAGMELVISNASNLPIYEQIVEGIKRHISSGALQ